MLLIQDFGSLLTSEYRYGENLDLVLGSLKEYLFGQRFTAQ